MTDSPLAFPLRHFAPGVLRARRGSATSIVAIPMTTPVSIPRIPLDRMERIQFRSGFETRTMLAYGGRLWRAARPGLPVRDFLDVLSADADMVRLRSETVQLGVEPLALGASRNGRAMIVAVDRITEGQTERLALDGSKRARIAVTEAFATRFAHDGREAWIAVDPPFLGAASHAVLSGPPDGWLHVDHRGLVESVDDFVQYVAQAEGCLTNDTERKLRETARSLAESMNGLVVASDADLRRFAAIASSRTLLIARTSLSPGHAVAASLGDGLPAARALAEALRPAAALASCGLLEDAELPQAMDAIRALASHIEPHVPDGPSKRDLVAAVAYVERMARPRFARLPVPEADADSLGTLTP